MVGGEKQARCNGGSETLVLMSHGHRQVDPLRRAVGAGMVATTPHGQ